MSSISADRDHYYFVEMSVDASTFGDDASEEKIAAGQFVSFRYITNDSGGPPLNPKISFGTVQYSTVQCSAVFIPPPRRFHRLNEDIYYQA